MVTVNLLHSVGKFHRIEFINKKKQMKKGLYLLLLMCCISVNGQSFENSWLGHYSYNNVIDISLGSDKIYGASENAFFTYDLQSNEII